MATNKPVTLEGVFLMNVVLYFDSIKDCFVFVQVNKKCMEAVRGFRRCPVRVNNRLLFHLLDIFPQVETIQVDSEELDNIVPHLPPNIINIELTSMCMVLPKHTFAMLSELRLDCFDIAILDVEMPRLRKLVVENPIMFQTFKEFSLKFTHIKFFVCHAIINCPNNEKLPSPPFRLVLWNQQEDCFVPNVQGVVVYNRLVDAFSTNTHDAETAQHFFCFDLRTNASVAAIQACLPANILFEGPMRCFPVPSSITQCTTHLTMTITDDLPPEPTQRIFFTPQNTFDGEMLNVILLTNVHDMIFPANLPQLKKVKLCCCFNINISKTQSPMLEMLEITKCTNITANLPPLQTTFAKFEEIHSCTIRGIHNTFPFLSNSDTLSLEGSSVLIGETLKFVGLTTSRIDISSFHLRSVFLSNCTTSKLVISANGLECVDLIDVAADSVVIETPTLVECNMTSCSSQTLTISSVDNLTITKSQVLSVAVKKLINLSFFESEPPVVISVGTSVNLAMDAVNMAFFHKLDLQSLELRPERTEGDVDLSQLLVNTLVVCGSFRSITLPRGLREFVNEAYPIEHIWGVEQTFLPKSQKNFLIRFYSQEKRSQDCLLEALCFEPSSDVCRKRF